MTNEEREQLHKWMKQHPRKLRTSVPPNIYGNRVKFLGLDPIKPHTLEYGNWHYIVDTGSDPNWVTMTRRAPVVAKEKCPDLWLWASFTMRTVQATHLRCRQARSPTGAGKGAFSAARDGKCAHLVTTVLIRRCRHAEKFWDCHAFPPWAKQTFYSLNWY